MFEHLPPMKEDSVEKFLSHPPPLGCDNSADNSAAFYTADLKLFSINLLSLFS
jgi:hypothetical protein